MIVQFRNEKVSNHGSITITIDCNVVAFIVFEEGFHQPIKRTKQYTYREEALSTSESSKTVYPRTVKEAGIEKNFDFDQSLKREQKPSVEETRRHFSKTSFRLCRGWNHSQTPAKRCQFEQFQLYYLRRGEISGINVFIGYIVRASNKGARKKKGRIFPYFSKMYKNALKEDLIRVVENLDGTVESTDTIVKLKTKIENSSTFESDPDFVKTLIQNCIDERVSRNEERQL
ncbi:hypothetical protein TNCV_2676271 [Trichonephila clavipes]|nr:hypothetical protein TNCV_2676271 [Trichonephila clavipes]